MAKNLNYKKARAIKDSQEQRIYDMRSGGKGSLRSSLFNRQDEALTKETIKKFKDEFWDMILDEKVVKVGGGNMPGSNGKKHVCGVIITLPEKVQIGNIEALLTNKLDYDKGTHTLKAYYRPENGKWGQAENVNEDFN